MKQFTTIAFLSCFFLTAIGQAEGFDLKSIQKSLAKVEDGLYFSKYEVSNQQYATFLEQLKVSELAHRYPFAVTDSAQWRVLTAYNEPFVKYYHTHPAYADYPAVNMSHEGATLFCLWLTEEYNSSDKRKFKKVKFRLPTEEEWIAAAKGGNPAAIYPWKGNDLMNKKGVFLCNFVRAANDTMGVAGKFNDNADVTAPCNSYWPNHYGLYNMSGNVAEMLAEKGKTMGGSWLDEAEAMKIESRGKYASYDTPMPTIGFRFVMEVVEE